MQLAADAFVDVTASFGVVRCAVAAPAVGTWPLLLCFPDIFGNSPAHWRVMRRLAGHGFVVVSPEPWAHATHAIPAIPAIPTGTVFDFDADRDRALAAQDLANADAADAARCAVVDHFAPLTRSVCAIGFCYGGHLALRAALDKRVMATVCCYATGLHKGLLGNVACDTLADAAAIAGAVLLVWGRNDPHIPKDGRDLIHRRLDAENVRYEARFFDAAHAFMRDVGERYDPAATDEALTAALALFRRA
jgi:carboxymethylenebutenolidase